MLGLERNYRAVSLGVALSDTPSFGDPIDRRWVDAMHSGYALGQILAGTIRGSRLVEVHNAALFVKPA